MNRDIVKASDRAPVGSLPDFDSGLQWVHRQLTRRKAFPEPLLSTRYPVTTATDKESPYHPLFTRNSYPIRNESGLALVKMTAEEKDAHDTAMRHFAEDREEFHAWW
jgi:hypothetical protein